MNGPDNAASPLRMVRALALNRHLIWQMTQREVVGRYRGSMMGLLWSFFHPLFMLAVYTFVFSVVFTAKWGQSAGDSKAEFAIILFAGLIIFNLFSEVLNRAPTLVLGNVNFVKKVIFPLEILPIAVLGSAIFHALISLAVLLAFSFLFLGKAPVTLLLWPLVVSPLILMTLGLSWFLASLGVFLRDVSQTISILTTALLFLSPIFFPASILPENYQVLIYLNPLTFIVEQAREVLIWGRMPDWQGLGLYALAGLVVAWAGFFWFQKTRRGFADVL